MAPIKPDSTDEGANVIPFGSPKRPELEDSRRDKATCPDAIRLRLAEAGIPYDSPAANQIKIGAWNFYPSTGTIYRDGNDKSHPDRGVDALIRLIKGSARL